MTLKYNNALRMIKDQILQIQIKISHLFHIKQIIKDGAYHYIKLLHQFYLIKTEAKNLSKPFYLVQI